MSRKMYLKVSVKVLLGQKDSCQCCIILMHHFVWNILVEVKFTYTCFYIFGQLNLQQYVIFYENCSCQINVVRYSICF